MTAAVVLVISISAFVLGSIIGSFLTVVIARVPAGESIVRPRSACPVCGQQIAWFDNIPILSWLLLGGRCRNCGTSIPVRYPLVEVVTGLTFAIIAISTIAGLLPVALLPMALVVAASGVALAVIDLEHHRLPNAIVYTTYPLALVAGAAGLAVTGEWSRLLGLALGAALWGLVIGGAWLVTRGRGMGLGDVKLAPLLGGSLGAIGALEAAAGLLIALVIGAVVGGVLLAGGKVARRQAIAFGPFMILGWFLTMVVGTALVDWYLALLLG